MKDAAEFAQGLVAEVRMAWILGPGVVSALGEGGTTRRLAAPQENLALSYRSVEAQGAAAERMACPGVHLGHSDCPPVPT